MYTVEISENNELVIKYKNKIISGGYITTSQGFTAKYVSSKALQKLGIEYNKTTLKAVTESVKQYLLDHNIIYPPWRI